MQTPQRKLKDIQRLLSAFPASSQAEPALVLHNFLTAVDDWSADHVEDAVTMFIKGQVPGHDGRFAPTAPMLAGACRLVLEKYNRARYLEGIAAPRLPPPDIEKTPEQRERAKAKVAEFVASVGAEAMTEAETQERSARWAKVNARFDPPQDEASISARLIKYTLGSPESERESA